MAEELLRPLAPTSHAASVDTRTHNGHWTWEPSARPMAYSAPAGGHSRGRCGTRACESPIRKYPCLRAGVLLMQKPRSHSC
jgi:hypothetical protein